MSATATITPRRSLSLVLLIVFAVQFSSCEGFFVVHDDVCDADVCDGEMCPGGDCDRDGVVNSADKCNLGHSRQDENHNGYQDTDGCWDTLPAQFYQAVANDIDTFFEDEYGVEGKTELGVYEGNEEPVSECSVDPQETNNFFCDKEGKNGTVYLDGPFMQKELDRVGKLAAYLGASDMAHRVQFERGIISGNELTAEDELQSVCIAGAWAGTESAKGLLDITEAEIRDGVKELFEGGDPTDPAYDVSRQGSPPEREQKFIEGLEGRNCFE